jgi:serine/threonine protein phosphatase PrpC
VVGNRGEALGCGDSRVFLFPKNGEVLLLTRDQNDFFDRYQAEHGPVPFPLANPVEYYERSRTFKGKNELLNCLGMEKAKPFALDGENAVPLQAGDQLLLCTDGLYRYLPFGVLFAVISQASSPEDVVKELFERALTAMQARQNSRGDNIAIVLYRHGYKNLQIP